MDKVIEYLFGEDWSNIMIYAICYVVIYELGKHIHLFKSLQADNQYLYLIFIGILAALAGKVIKGIYADIKHYIKLKRNHGFLTDIEGLDK